MSSKYFLSYCVKPTFLQKKKKDAKMCGLVNGFVYTFFLSLLIITFSIRFYYLQEKEDVKQKIILYVSILLALLWILVPMFRYYSEGSKWDGYKSLLLDLQKDGYTRQQAISFIQNIDSSQGSDVPKNIKDVVFANKDQQQRSDKKEVE
jgi:hypothetical protein